VQNSRAVKTRVAIVVVGMLVGLAVGVGGYTFVYAKGYSYLTNDPAACANCHVMNLQGQSCVRCHWDVGHMK
jgi:cytochrome c nitrite reductase small subunit